MYVRVISEIVGSPDGDKDVSGLGDSEGGTSAVMVIVESPTVVAEPAGPHVRLGVDRLPVRVPRVGGGDGFDSLEIVNVFTTEVDSVAVTLAERLDGSPERVRVMTETISGLTAGLVLAEGSEIVDSREANEEIVGTAGENDELAGCSVKGLETGAVVSAGELGTPAGLSPKVRV